MPQPRLSARVTLLRADRDYCDSLENVFEASEKMHMRIDTPPHVQSALSWGTAMGKEFAAKGANVQLGPGLCLARVPSGGRNFEYISGEDPVLGAKLAQGAVQGIQSQGVIATVKHYVLNNQETNRNTVSVVCDERTFMELYFPPFQGAIDAGVGAVMCSYNLVNGTHACGNNATLNRFLKEIGGFDGFVMSDWRATHSTGSILAGLDQEMPGLDSGPKAPS